MNRRALLQAAAALAPTIVAGEGPAPARIVDTHTHFYDPTRPQGVPWPEKGSPLHRRVMPDDWAALALPHGVTHTIVVEASEWVEDTQWLLDLAAKDARLLGVIGNLDPLALEFSAHLKRFSANPLFRGIRNRRPNTELRTVVDDPRFRTSMSQLAENGLSLDVNITTPSDLDALARLAGAVPELRIVIDHVGGAGDPRRLADSWKTGMRAAGRSKNVYCKVSGLVEQTDSGRGQAPRDLEFYLPILNHVWNCFGENRVIFGSNWPVSDQGAPYEAVIRLVREFFAGHGAAASRRFFLANSRDAYRWRDR